MVRKTFTLAISWLLVVTLASLPTLARTATASLSKQQAQEAKHKKRIVEWGTNKNVTVKLKSGSKVEGRLADIKDENFVVQLVENGQVVSRDIRYSEIDKLSAKGETSGGKVAGYIVIGALAALGTIILIGLSLGD